MSVKHLQNACEKHKLEHNNFIANMFCDNHEKIIYMTNYLYKKLPMTETANFVE